MDRRIAGAAVAHGCEPRLDIDRRATSVGQLGRQEGVAICRGLFGQDQGPHVAEPVSKLLEVIAALPFGDDAYLAPLIALAVVRARQAHEAGDPAHGPAARARAPERA